MLDVVGIGTTPRMRGSSIATLTTIALMITTIMGFVVSTLSQGFTNAKK